MKYLTNKKLWAAIIGLMTAFGTLMVTLDEAKAGTWSLRETYWSTNKCSNIGGKMEQWVCKSNGSIINKRMDIAFMNTGVTVSKEVYIIYKWDVNDSSTWEIGWPSNGSIYLGPRPLQLAYKIPVFSGSLPPNITKTYTQYNSTLGQPDVISIVVDNSLNGIMNLDCVFDIPIN